MSSKAQSFSICAILGNHFAYSFGEVRVAFAQDISVNDY